MKYILGFFIAFSLITASCKYCTECTRVETCLYCTDSLGTQGKVNCFSAIDAPANFTNSCENAGGTVYTTDDLILATDFCGKKKDEREAYKITAAEQAFTCVDK